MPLLRITARDARPSCHDADMPLDALLSHAHDSAAPGPVVIMVHGYKYAPGHPQHCPHDGLQGLAAVRRKTHVVSWPRRLGYSNPEQARGFAISFGWAARGSVWQAWRAADRAGTALACVLSTLRRYAPGRQVHLFVHSMGARVALSAVSQASAGDVGTAILLAPAEFSGTAEAAIRSPAGRAAQFLHVASAENALFDTLVQSLLPTPTRGDRPMGRRAPICANLATLRLEDPLCLSTLGNLGHPIASPSRRVCHWSSYLRPGLFPFYRAILGGDIAIPELGALLPVQSPAPQRRMPLFLAPKLSH